MIHLCYLQPDLSIDGYQKQIDLSKDYFTEDDLLITNMSSVLSNQESYKCKIMNCNNIDFEYIGRTKLDNIVMFDFEDISDNDLEKLIFMKSKKTEILGCSCWNNPTWRKMHTDLQMYKDSGCGTDAIILAMGLQYHTNPTVMHMLSTNYRLKSNVKHKEITSINDLLTHLKRTN